MYYITSLPDDLLQMGDFNLHNKSSSLDVRQVTSILESFDLNLYVDFPKHLHDQSLDFIIQKLNGTYLGVEV